MQHLFESVWQGKISKDTWEKTVKCQECNAKFFFKIELNKHINNHTKNFMCDICDYLGSSAHYLNTHMISHKILYLQNLWQQKIMLTHSEVRKHKCDYCGKAFIAKKNLNEHTKIHTGKFSRYCPSWSIIFFETHWPSLNFYKATWDMSYLWEIFTKQLETCESFHDREDCWML